MARSAATTAAAALLLVLLVMLLPQAHGPDRVFGGFHGTLDASGQPRTPTSKGLVQLTRHVWAFATYWMHGYATSGSGSSSRSEAGGRVHTARTAPGDDDHADEDRSSSSALPLLNSQQLSRTAFDFLVQHLLDRRTGMFAWMATREGGVLQDNHVIYGEWFVLYSFRCVWVCSQQMCCSVPQAHSARRVMFACMHARRRSGPKLLPRQTRSCC